MYNQQEQYNPLNTALKDKMIKNKGFKSRKEAVIVTRLLIK